MVKYPIKESISTSKGTPRTKKNVDMVEDCLKAKKLKSRGDMDSDTHAYMKFDKLVFRKCIYISL